jgi:hypothetical protein
VVELVSRVVEVSGSAVVVVDVAGSDEQPPTRTTRTRMPATSRLFFMPCTSLPAMAMD